MTTFGVTMINLSRTLFTDLCRHGQEAYPEECCGAMLGQIDVKTQTKHVTQLVRIENSSEENRHRRFAVTPKDYMQLERQAMRDGLALLGFYHTHPDHPCEPSETDLKHAWPVFSYIILSVLKGEASTCRSFLLKEDKSGFEEEKLDLQV
eukprot:COSAG01_NODE_775_length_13698_cov_60.191632_8_plen_150_part_00